MDKTFKVEADFEFLAANIDEALLQIGYHFMCRGLGIESSEGVEIHTKQGSIRCLEPVGKINVTGKLSVDSI